MKQQAKQNKILRQHRSEQKDTKCDNKGADLEDLLLSDPAHTALPEQALWRAVILQMITDALSNSQKRDQLRFKKDAWHWLTNHSRDFRMVCDYAGYDPNWLQEQINRFLAQHTSPFRAKANPRQALQQHSARFGINQPSAPIHISPSANISPNASSHSSQDHHA